MVTLVRIDCSGRTSCQAIIDAAQIRARVQLHSVGLLAETFFALVDYIVL